MGFEFDTSTSGFKYFILSCYTGLWTIHGLLMFSAQDSNGNYYFHPAFLVLISEMCKVVLSYSLWKKQSVSEPLNWKKGRVYAIPGLIYTLYNNLMFVTLQYWDPAQFKVFSNARVLLTAIFLVIGLRKRYSKQHWIALIILTLSLTLVSLDKMHDNQTEIVSPSLQDPEEIVNVDPTNQPQGTADTPSDNADGLNTADTSVLVSLIIVLSTVSLSSFASVFNEYLLKSDDGMGLNQQNLWQYIYSTGINLLILFATQSSDSEKIQECPSMSFTLFGSCINFTFIILVVIKACGGLVTAMILKYLDSVLKTIAAAVEMFTTAFIVSIIYGKSISGPFFLAMCFSSGAIYLFTQAKVDAEEDAATDNYITPLKAESMSTSRQSEFDDDISSLELHEKSSISDSSLFKIPDRSSLEETSTPNT